MGMETIAIVLLILFTLEIIFIFVYSSQKDDTETEEKGWGPPELPIPPSTNIFEGPPGRYGPPGPHGPPGRRPGRWDDDDYDFDGDFKKKNKLHRVHFFLVENHNGLERGPKQEVGSDFNKNSDDKEFTVRLDEITDNDLKKFKNKEKVKLFMTYRPTQLKLKWKLMHSPKIPDDPYDKNIDVDGDINLGKLSDLKKVANGKDLILKIKILDDDW